jgi:lambda repressor-like predicted transcriptional regulator
MPTFAMTAALRHVLAARRATAGISLRDLEKHGAGISYASLSRFENGAVPEYLDRVVCAYARALDVAPSELWREALRVCEADPTGAIATTSLRGRRAVGECSAK